MAKPQMERAVGVLLGQFVGDALGTTLEFKGAQECVRLYPQGLRQVVGGGPFGMLPGQVTDDGESAVTLARTLVAHGLDLDARAQAYAAWMKSSPKDVGRATAGAFGIWPKDVTAALMRARTQKNSNPGQQANGALMRVSPLGIFSAGLSPAQAVALAHEDAALSHPSPVCLGANAALVRALQVGLTGGTAAQGLSAAQEAVARDPHMQAVAQALDDIDKLPACDGPGQGWVLVALRVAFHMLMKGNSFEESLVATVMAGGDTDTNGAITGALLGAYLGEDAIPAQWKHAVLACQPRGRPREYHVGDAQELAGQLLK